MRRKSAASERGSAVMIVLTWTVLLLFLGMSIDYGIVLRYRRAMQNACDAGVMSGGLDLKTNPGVVVTKTQAYANYDYAQNFPRDPNGFTVTAQTLDANGSPTSTNPVQDRANVHATVRNLFFTKLVVPSVPISIECTSRIVPANKTGLQPVGMVYQQWQTIWNQIQNNPCPLIGAPLSASQQACATDAQLTVGVNSQTYGSGNTGTLDLQNPTSCAGLGGNALWACVFENGTGTGTGTPPPPYCANQIVTGSNPPAGVTPWPACSTVQTATGDHLGSANGNTGLNGAVSTLCSTPNPYVANGPVNTASKWIVILPLLDPSIWGPNGSGVTGKSVQIDIVGFAAFELDCPHANMPGPYNPNFKFSGGTATIYGRFVSVLDKQAITGCIPTPNNAQTCTDTGVETLILVE